ncbi:MAG: hypothetical protein UY79_C0003G0048 [Parcubacteria group bacterium GW2011_GWA2_53_21]|nr:MAG: hypothetical protein UY79_C0003G0048 [Parcubacteria group bacterium GW2011_GWA2_53_21]
MATSLDTAPRTPDRRDPPLASPDTGPSLGTGGRRGRRRGRRDGASAPLSSEEIARRARMDEDRARATAYVEARSARAAESDASARLTVAQVDDESRFRVTVNKTDGETITLQELLGASADAKTGLSVSPETPVAESVSLAKADRKKKFKEKRSAILGAETKYLGTLKDAKEAFLEEFRAASSQVNEQVGVHLDALLGVKEADVEKFFDAWMREEGSKAIAPWELPENELEHRGYKNRATGEYEDAVPWRARDWKKNWKMFWSTRDNNQDRAVRRKLSYSFPRRAVTEVGNFVFARFFNVVGFGTAMVLAGKSLWRSTAEPLAYWGVRGFTKIVAGGLEPFGVKGGWADKVWKEPPWKKRGDWPFMGPVMKLFGAMKRGTPWGEGKSGAEGKKGKKKD